MGEALGTDRLLLEEFIFAGVALTCGAIVFAVGFGGSLLYYHHSRIPAVTNILETIRMEEVNHRTFSSLLTSLGNAAMTEIVASVFALCRRIFMNLIRRM